jgi:putative molybdopterin biosynthesis protein
MSYSDDNTTAGALPVRNCLSDVRRRQGISAALLARRAGVSRQTVYAIEAGDYVPNTAVALRLARALEVPLEELFSLDPAGTAPAPRAARATLISPAGLFAGSAVELCRVGRRLVGVPAVPAPRQLLPADAVLLDARHSTVRLLGAEPAAGRLLLAGCDPAASLVARHLARAGVALVTAPVNSSAALGLLKQRLVHFAGTHLKDARGGEPNRAAIRKAFPHRGVAVFAFATWEEGLVAARGNPKRLRRIEDLARPGITLVNREKGSGSRQLLDRLLDAAGIPPHAVAGYSETPATGHLPAAWRVYTGLADCCIATRSAARAFGLDFTPLTTERYDLVVRAEDLDLAPVARALDALTQFPLRRELEALCGYDTSETGRRII